MKLIESKCVPCEGGTPPLTKEQAEALLPQVPEWKLMVDDKTLWREYKFNNFADAMDFANKIAVLADKEGHHPNLTVSWGKVLVELSTHEIGGLSENDFILAAKIDAL